MLALLTAHPDTWELSDVPGWLCLECADLGLVRRSTPSGWKLTEKGYLVLSARLEQS